ncbi:MAG: hypothetical protein M1826_003080 [Phylliscum demangeonii]|nr:MAG: hypothetical protein M1826_003080 [Phylliscum demangeonii]
MTAAPVDHGLPPFFKRHSPNAELTPSIIRVGLTQVLSNIYRDIQNAAALSMPEGTPMPFVVAPGEPPLQTYVRRKLEVEDDRRRSLIAGARLCADVPRELKGRLMGAVESGMRNLLQTNVLGGVAYSAARTELDRSQRLADLAGDLGWMMLSILSFSDTFQAAVDIAPDPWWEAMVTALSANARSLEMFAKSRRLPWRSILEIHVLGAVPLSEEQIGSNYEIVFTHPHEWFLPMSGPPQRCWAQNLLQRNVDTFLYDDSLFADEPMPRGWPANRPWPSNPLLIEDGAGCVFCHADRCECTVTDVTNTLVEIVEYPGAGRGVRALEAIPKNFVIGEYTGAVIPKNSVYDRIYSLSINNTECEIIALVSSLQYGNWTRYINHSCRPSTVFSTWQVGGRRAMCVETIRPVEVFEQITVDYGNEYWSARRLCQCGEECCKFDTVQKCEIAANERDEAWRPRQKARKS